ncbi:enoyl-CoA hydratase [Endozoicomonas montiporae]|uniref:Enoyl-CoA hydratase n=2 Tax=Endozoicomonas montiporae TaxID=1027273 RepID=A0A081NB57_9GAMM|nr:enoyl-CoA hydratase [Endozoicomonas montiporae]AMO56604.1 putative enoyl-CoA hydratase [Endozoicomonas montiporae CL-33]KEQ15680.1 enoyl-CoA hydratase [Endozoicomonas montiporae]
MIKSPTEKLKLNIIDHTALITLDNPGANTWDLENLQGLYELVEQLNADRSIYALVITGAGEKFFSAGADLKLFNSGDKVAALDMAKAFGKAFEALSDFRGVTIAAINGFAMGGGLEVALACDIRIAENHAQLALPEAKVGLLPAAGGTQRLSWLVGEGWAKRMILCGERITAGQAEKIGLIEEVVAMGSAKDSAFVLAAKVAEQSPIAVSYCKQLIHHARNTSINAALPEERERFLDLFDTDDQQEGVSAFLEKRKPQWKNA